MEQVSTILIADDDHEIVEVMRDFFLAEGFRVATAADGAEVLARVAEAPIDCLLLDIMMPGPSGFEICRQIRLTSDVPILFLTARATDMEKLRGFAQGADDYIVKSATAAEVVARVKAVLRRTRPANAARAILHFGRLVVDLLAHEVRVAGQPVALTAREYALLLLFIEHPHQVLTHEQIFERIWGDIGDRHTTTVYVKRLREKIEENADTPTYIVTVWGVGYRFEGRLQ